MKRALVVVIIGYMICFTCTNVFAQKKKLSYGQVYLKAEPSLLGILPKLDRWIDDEHYLESYSDPAQNISKLIRVNVKSGKADTFIDYTDWERTLPQEIKPKSFIHKSESYNTYLYSHRSDLYFYSRISDVFKRLTASSSRENNATFSPNEEWVAFTRNNNLYVVNISTGLEKQLTFDGSETIYNGRASWVYYEEILGRRSKYRAFWWSPNSEMIAFLRFDDAPVPEFPIFSSDGIHGKLEIQRYPKAGDPLPAVRLGIVHINTQKVVWINTKDITDEYIAWPEWSPDSQTLLYQWKNRKQNQLKIYKTDPTNGQSTEMYHETQSSWIDDFEDVEFTNQDSEFIYRSDKNGWPTLYRLNLDGTMINQVTSGKISVQKIVMVDKENEMIFFQGWEKESTQTHLFKINFEGDNLTQLTKTPGTHSCTVSPGGKYFYDRYSNIEQPTKIDLCDASGKLIRTIGDQKLAVLDYYSIGTTEIFTIPSGDGLSLPALWVLPPDFDKAKQYPVIFRIYGGPGRGTVRNSFRRLSDHYLAQFGIIIISVDHRGSHHFGKEGMSRMYRNLGKYEVEDLIAAVKWLKGKSFIDSTKIGISGGSYGGYVTCMALTYGADYFTHGIASSSVTDWRLYDAVYTERYMDLPIDNPEGYDFGSAMTHADKYKGKLLLMHGTMDDNVHMQNTIQLVDEFTDLNKDFELSLVPDSRHGFSMEKRKYSTRVQMEFWFQYLLNMEWPENKNQN